MKKGICLLLWALLCVLTGCAEGSASSKAGGSQSASVSDVLAAGMAAADAGVGDTEAQTPSPDSGNPINTGSTDGGAGRLDVDLTILSSTMVYSEVYNMMVSPADYVGKTVKMGGTFAYYHDEAADQYYFACIIQDATACCAQGIEFELVGDPVFPDDFPAAGSTITVVGVFDTYMEDGYQYCTLREARFV